MCEFRTFDYRVFGRERFYARWFSLDYLFKDYLTTI